MQENFGAALGSAGCGTRTEPKGTALLRTGIISMVFLQAALLLALPAGNGIASNDGPQPPASEVAAPAPCSSCREFDRLNSLVRNGEIPKETARAEIPVLLNRIREWYHRAGGKRFGQAEWVFPLRGYTVSAIEGGQNHGYLPKGYNYYDGNRHGGHPSLDIFIHDRNQDDRDDRTGEYVAVLAVAGGIVVARETEWHEESALRGGKYLWIYDPSTDHLFYYAHLREITVSIGSLVAPGDTLGFVGRTGLNAYKKRSPTHLHLTCLSTTTGSLLPVNVYLNLLRARTVK